MPRNPEITNLRWPLALLGVGFAPTLALLSSNKNAAVWAWILALAPLITGVIWGGFILLSPRPEPVGGSPPSPTSRRDLIVNAAVTLSAALIGAGGVLPWYLNQPAQASEQIRKCEHRHGLEQARSDVHKLKLSKSERRLGTYSHVSISTCQWPPPGYADKDGFSRIDALSMPGPGQDEASGADAIDRYMSDCSKLQLAYSIGTQGSFSHQPPFVAQKGAIVDAWAGGKPWPPPGGGAGLDAGDINPYPGRDEVVVVRNDKIAPDYEAIHCVE